MTPPIPDVSVNSKFTFPISRNWTKSQVFVLRAFKNSSIGEGRDGRGFRYVDLHMDLYCAYSGCRIWI